MPTSSAANPAEGPGNRESPQDVFPRPDPTALTTDQLRRELANLREIIEARLDGMDVAMELHLEALPALRIHIDKVVAHLRDLMDEKFRAVDQQFQSRDWSSEKSDRAGREALEAALISAKELVNATTLASSTASAKSEESFTKQLDAANARITELKERVDRSSGIDMGAQAKAESKRSDSTLIIGIASAGIAFIAVIVSVILVAYRSTGG